MPSADPPVASALTDIIQSQPAQSVHPPHYYHLALQIRYDLQYQHDWTNLHIHSEFPLTKLPLPRPMISGLPPHRIYVHPDDQLEELKRGVKDAEVKVNMEWVLPTNLKETWRLSKFAEIFDVIGEEPPNVQQEDGEAGSQEIEKRHMNGGFNQKRKGGKRLLLAILGDDSTVVYYIVHDGIVKPRQN